MKIEIRKLKDEENIQLQDSIPAVNWDMDGMDVQFVDNIELKSTFYKIRSEVIVDTEVTTKCKITCSRCLEVIDKTNVQNYQHCYSLVNLGDYLDIDDDIREDILLNFPIKFLCKKDCKGLCLKCGINLNLGKCNCK